MTLPTGDHIPDLATLRAMAHQAVAGDGDAWGGLWDVFGDGDPALADIDLRDLVTEEIEIIGGVWGQSRTSGEDKFVAYSLGLDAWYVFHTNTLDETELDSVILIADQEQGFRQIARRWLQDSGATGGTFPTEFASIFADQPWFIHEFATALAGSEYEAADSLEEDVLNAADIADSSIAAVRDCWWTAVRAESELVDTEFLDVALAAVGDDIPGFDAWVDGASLKWVDTGEPLNHDDAQGLRLACQFLRC